MISKHECRIIKHLLEMEQSDSWEHLYNEYGSMAEWAVDAGYVKRTDDGFVQISGTGITAYNEHVEQTKRNRIVTIASVFAALFSLASLLLALFK